MKDKKEIIGSVENLAYGGYGLLKVEGKAVFVPFTAPGDRVRVRIDKEKKRHAFGSLLEILEPSIDRVIPRCPYFGICGGCQLQHIDYSLQLKHKKQVLADHLQRIGGISTPPFIEVDPSPVIYGYRRHIRLKLLFEKSWRMGYTDLDGSFLPIEQCPIFEEKNAQLAIVHTLLQQLKGRIGLQGKLRLIKNKLPLLYFEWQSAFPANFEEVAKQFSAICGIIGRCGDKVACYGWVNEPLIVEGLHITYAPDAFLQANPQKSAAIYRRIVQEAAGYKKAVDLYCGVGISTLLLAKSGLSCIGVEVHQKAVLRALENARINGLGAKFFSGKAEVLTKKILKEYKPDLLLVNPPRGGLDCALRATIDASDVDQLIYVSCMPATLARDVCALKNFSLVKATVYDMFPQTGHLECMLILKKKPSLSLGLSSI